MYLSRLRASSLVHRVNIRSKWHFSMVQTAIVDQAEAVGKRQRCGNAWRCYLLEQILFEYLEAKNVEQANAFLRLTDGQTRVDTLDEPIEQARVRVLRFYKTYDTTVLEGSPH